VYWLPDLTPASGGVGSKSSSYSEKPPHECGQLPFWRTVVSEQWAAKYRALIEAVPDAMVVVDDSGAIVLLNVQAERQFGYRHDELVGKKVTTIIPQGFAERLIADEARSPTEALSQQIGTGIELSGRRKDGSDFPLEVMLSPSLIGAEGSWVTAAIRNITNRKDAEEQLFRKVEELKRSNDELEQFAYVASHDLQEPLRMVASFTQLLAERYKGQLDDEAHEFIAYAVDGANRMKGLIEALLEYSRIGMAGRVFHEESAEGALKQALENLYAPIRECGAEVTHDFLPAINMDNSHLVQLFQNLIGNAIKYRNTESPHVHISAARHLEREWLFSVRDNGIGIETEYFDRIFVIFQRLHGRQEFAGTGIGLSICKKIVEQYGGKIWVESDYGKGATFFFTVPTKDVG
jgi:PAS domain S-box-containing protein